MARKKSREREFIENIEIIDIAAEGKAIAKVDNLVIFIPFVVPGDIVDVEIIKKKKNYAEARAIKFHKYSPNRIETKCPHFGICGGCKWQMLDYKYQLEAKGQQVLDNLSRIGHIDISGAQPIIGSDKIYYYRNKLEFTFSTKRWFTEEEIKTLEENSPRQGFGFHIQGFFDKVIDIKYCALQREPSNQIRNFLREYSLEKKLSYYDIRNHSGLLRNVIIRSTDKDELMVIVVFAEMSDEIFPLLETLGIKFPEITSLMYCINSKFNDTLYDQDILVYKGKDHITEYMPAFKEGGKELRFKIGAKSFYQTNSLQAFKLYSKAAEYANLNKDMVVYDLYTGIGSIASFVSPYVNKVVGIEYVDMAIEDAKANAIENGLTNTEFYAGDIAKILDKEFVEKHGKPDLIITDPPRAGMGEKVVNMLLEIGAKNIVYISCNPATQARDLAQLSSLYDIKRIQPVDMFPHTHHIENIVELVLR